MIDLYTWSTPNGRKISIALEEMALPYTVIPIDIFKGGQHTAEYEKVSPNQRIPAIVDQDTGMTLMESGAILIYLAEKSGLLLPTDATQRMRTLEWLMWQMGGFGPMLGQAHHFVHYRPDASEYARERYKAEAARLYGVLNRRLDGREYMADQYSIADIAIWPWASRYAWQGIDLANYPHVLRWYKQIACRPAVIRGYQVPDSSFTVPMP